jgi:hypothetical protein
MLAILSKKARGRNLFIALSPAFALLLSCTPAFAQYKPSEQVPADWKVGFDSITETESQSLLTIFASDSFAGRGTGQVGYIKAAHFVAGKLAEYGFEPIGDNETYFQALPFSRIGPNLEASSITIGERTFQAADGLGFVSFSATQELTADVVFISAFGDRVSVPDKSEIKDKTVVINAKDTGLSFLRPLLQAEPAAIIQIVDGEPENRSRISQGNANPRGGRMRLQITRALAASLAEICKVDPNIVAAEPAEAQLIQVGNQELKIDFRVLDQPIRVPNVVGWLPGSDPELRDEYIVVGAHLDHLGERDGEIFPGADDNASGSVAIVQLAKALHENPVKPKRSVLYLAFAAEEIGLVGSAYYVEHPLRPLEKCVCMLNIDMIGRNEETASEPATENEISIHLVGVKDIAPELHETVLAANKYVGFDFEYDEERVATRSDQASFGRKGIPTTFLFGGFNPHYHQTSDTLTGINYTKIANAARLNYLCVMLASDHGPFPRLQEK